MPASTEMPRGHYELLVRRLVLAVAKIGRADLPQEEKVWRAFTLGQRWARWSDRWQLTGEYLRMCQTPWGPSPY